ncbi:MAG: ADP-ribosylglycohydrolase family protein [Planctomycetaceae bacterium]
MTANHTIKARQTAGKAGQTSGCLIGTAIGDALGLPYEGMTAARASRMLGAPNRFRFLFGRGMMSDDTEHSCMVAESLLESAFDVRQFEASFANRLRWWLLGAPAGTGLATLRACLRLVFGVPSHRSGVFSAGNGPAMRAAIIGAAVDDPSKLQQLVHCSTRITHTDPRAEAGALIVAAAARISTWAELPTADALFQFLQKLDFDFSGNAESLMELIRAAAASVDRHETTASFAASIGAGGFVSGFVNQTVPISIHAWLSHPEDWERAVQSVIRCGGDADTTAAITGGIVGCRIGIDGIPLKLRQRFVDWPRSMKWLEELGRALAEPPGKSQQTVIQERVITKLLLRNVVFVPTVLLHGFRRLLPPY